MKRKPQRKTTKPIIYLIAEDVTGYYVFREIIRKKEINAEVKLRGKAEGVSPLAQELKEVIDTVLQEKSTKDCIVVLHDTDESVQTYRQNYQDIAQICTYYKKDVIRIQAKDEIESWLLADSGLCKWLGVKPKASDHLKRPSDHLKSLVNKKLGKHHWDKLHQPKILEHMDATGDQPKRSESMRIAMKALFELPCTQAKKQ